MDASKLSPAQVEALRFSVSALAHHTESTNCKLIMYVRNDTTIRKLTEAGMVVNTFRYTEVERNVFASKRQEEVYRAKSCLNRELPLSETDWQMARACLNLANDYDRKTKEQAYILTDAGLALAKPELP